MDKSKMQMLRRFAWRVSVALLIMAAVTASAFPHRAFAMWNVPQKVYNVPDTIPGDGSMDVTTQIQSFIDSVPDGQPRLISRIVFPANKVYGSNSPIRVDGRKLLIIDGNGSTFKKLVPTDFSNVNGGSTNRPNWLIISAHSSLAAYNEDTGGVALLNMIIKGGFPGTDSLGSSGTTGVPVGQAFDHGISLQGAKNVTIKNCVIDHPDGDAITLLGNLAIDPANPQDSPPCKNVTIDGVNGTWTSRHFIGSVNVDGLEVKNCDANMIYQWFVDAEVDHPNNFNHNLYIHDNTIRQMYFGAFALHGGNGTWPHVGSFRYVNNTMLVNGLTCLAPIFIGDTEDRFTHDTFNTQDVHIVNNIILCAGDGIQLVNVDNGEVSGNRIQKSATIDGPPGGAGCDPLGNPNFDPPCAVPIRQWGTSNVYISPDQAADSFGFSCAQNLPNPTPTAGPTPTAAPPAIISFTPTASEPGYAVTITGMGLRNAGSVNFNTTTATNVSYNSNTRIIATVPAGATTGPISVTTPGGTATTDGVYTVRPGPPPPTISAINPTSGEVGIPVTIAGTYLLTTGSVKFNGTSSTNISSTQDEQVIAFVPAGATSGPITLTTQGGTVTSPVNFTVTSSAPAPTIGSFSPASGAAGSSVPITGTNFTGANTVKFNGTTATFTVNSATQITATVPSGATTGAISVTTGGGTATSGSNFTVTSSTAPVITAINPTSAPAGYAVTLAGNNFNGTTSVKFNGTSAYISSIQNTQVIVFVPTGATTGPITLTTPNGTATGPVFTPQ